MKIFFDKLNLLFICNQSSIDHGKRLHEPEQSRNPWSCANGWVAHL